jgi:hypothetical protein
MIVILSIAFYFTIGVIVLVANKIFEQLKYEAYSFDTEQDAITILFWPFSLMLTVLMIFVSVANKMFNWIMKTIDKKER